mgnify:CR=1 FL=1
MQLFLLEPLVLSMFYFLLQGVIKFHFSIWLDNRSNAALLFHIGLIRPHFFSIMQAHQFCSHIKGGLNIAMVINLQTASDYRVIIEITKQQAT